MGITRTEAWKKFADLGNAAFESFLSKKGLIPHDYGVGRRWWFGGIKATSLEIITYDWETKHGEVYKGRSLKMSCA